MNKIQARNMLIDVVEHFSKDPVGLRSISSDGACLYNPPKTKPKSIGCAIGMFIPVAIAKKWMIYNIQELILYITIILNFYLIGW